MDRAYASHRCTFAFREVGGSGLYLMRLSQASCCASIRSIDLIIFSPNSKTCVCVRGLCRCWDFPIPILSHEPGSSYVLTLFLYTILDDAL